MCGSFATQSLTWAEIVRFSRLTSNAPLPDFADKPRFPLRRGAASFGEWQASPIIRDRDGSREAIEAQWGLIPRWWKPPISAKKFDTFNAVLEEICEKKSYKDVLDQRAAIPVSGFFEFTGPKGAKLKHEIRLRDQDFYFLAGFWDHNSHHEVTTFTVATTAPGPRMTAFHHRVPAILPNFEALDGYLRSSADEALEIAQQSVDALLVFDPEAPKPHLV